MDNIIYYMNRHEENEILSGNWTIFDRYEKNKLNAINDKNNDLKVRTLVLYSVKNLYVLVVSNQDKIINNDRAYQNGDGFHFVIAKPNEDGIPTDEFYVIGVSPLSNNKRRIFQWYKNVECTGKQITNGDIKYKYIDGNMYFLASISWEELNPYKPYICEKLGFNISFVRDINDEKKTFILKEDDYIQSENSLRKYELFKFENPTSNDTPDILIDLDKINCKTYENVMLRIAINSNNESTANIHLKINNKKCINKVKKVTKGLNLIRIVLNNYNLEEYNNIINLKVNLDTYTMEKNFQLYIYNEEKFNMLENKINTFNKAENMFLKESIDSLKFYCKDFNNYLSQLKEYESFETLDNYIKDIEYKLDLVKNGEDLFKAGQVIKIRL